MALKAILLVLLVLLFFMRPSEGLVFRVEVAGQAVRLAYDDVITDGLVLDSDGLLSLNTSLQISWYSSAKNGSKEEIPSTLSGVEERYGPIKNLLKLSPLLFRADLIEDSPKVIYFGGTNTSSFVCGPVAHLTRASFVCNTFLNTEGPIIATFLNISSDGNFNISEIDCSILDYAEVMIPIAILRLQGFQSMRRDFAETIVPANNERRKTSNVPAGFAIFFIVTAMFSVLIMLAVLLGWMFPTFNCIPKGRLYSLHFSSWLLIEILFLIIVSLLARFPGWIILGIIYAAIISLLASVYAHIRRTNESSAAFEMEMSSSGAAEVVNLDPWFTRRPLKLGKAQRLLLIFFAIFFVVSLVCVGIIWEGWKTSEYYVWDRESNSQIVEIQPPAVSKSTLALYTFDGLARAVDITFFLDIFTNWCDGYYRKPLDAKGKEEKILHNYIDLYQIDMNLFEPSDYTQYATVNDFFVRQLKPNSRPLAAPLDQAIFVSPADARILILPSLPKDFEVVIKEEKYSLSGILGNDQLALNYVDGLMVIVRLAPQDYHRYHAPINATVLSRSELAGSIYSVNADAVQSSNQVFMNQRVVSILNTSRFGQVAFVAVGATCVGSVVDFFEVNSVWNKGETVGQFEYGGSTLLLLFEQGKITVDDDLLLFSSLGVETLVKVKTQIGVASS